MAEKIIWERCAHCDKVADCDVWDDQGKQVAVCWGHSVQYHEGY